MSYKSDEPSPADRSSREGVRSILVFVLAVLTPILLVVGIYSGIQRWKEPNIWKTDEREALTVISSRSGNSSKSLSVPNAGGLFPKEGEDFLLAGWYRLRSLPGKNGRVLLFSEYESESASREGIILGIEGTGSGLKPTVYWRGSKGTVSWIEFNQFSVAAEEWFVVAVSWRRDSLLGVHVARPEMERERLRLPTLLGGYELGREQIPQPKAPIITGSSSGSRFRGDVGPLIIASGHNLRKQFPTLLQRFIEDPLALGRKDRNKNEINLFILRDEKGIRDVTDKNKRIVVQGDDERRS